MPRLQALIERYKNDPKVQFLTLNLDDKPGAIGPFLAKNHFTFTVLPAEAFARNSLRVGGIPENWIVDANGVVRCKEVGYDNRWIVHANGVVEEKWEEDMAAAIAKYEPAGPPPAAAGPPSHR